MEAYRILVVEDDQEILDGVGIYLKNQGYTVDEIRSLKEHYKNKYAELRSMLKDVKKQLKIADEIIREEKV